MTSILQYISEFLRSIDKVYLLLCAALAGLLLIINYRYGIETKWLYHLPHRWQRFAGFYLLYLTAFLLPWLLLYWWKEPVLQADVSFWILVLLAPAIFAAKVTAGGWKEVLAAWIPGVWGRYAGVVTDLPVRLLMVVAMLGFVRMAMPEKGEWWGLNAAYFSWKPYLMMLALMTPLIAFAATRPDFLAAYPKCKQVAFIYPYTSNRAAVNGMFELGYGIDFITIELFFRGFLVIAFARYAGMYAIIPMAVFYCSIHFGKPVLECISSFFGGMLLGIVACKTQSIFGGLLVHLGIAWMMELASWLGNWLRSQH